jgi:hypothetical protein
MRSQEIFDLAGLKYFELLSVPISKHVFLYSKTFYLCQISYVAQFESKTKI